MLTALPKVSVDNLHCRPEVVVAVKQWRKCAERIQAAGIP